MRKKSKKKKRSLKDLGGLYKALQIEAVFNAITNNNAFFERKVRRWFSKNFNTPLYDTYKLSWPDILIHYYESSVEDKSFNDTLDIAMDNYLPEFIHRKEEEDRAFAQSLVEEQRLSLASGKRKGKGKAKGKFKKPKEEPSKGKEMMNLKFDDKDFEGDKE